LTTPPHLIVLGDPASRRVSLFQAALARARQPPASVLSWRDFLADPSQLGELGQGAHTILRIDSFDDDFEVARALLRRGYERALAAQVWAMDPGALDRLQPERGRILPPRQLFLGFQDAIAELGALAAQRQWQLPSPPGAILACFDKRAIWQRCRCLGLPVAEAIHSVEGGELRDDSTNAPLPSSSSHGLDELLDAMRQRDWDRVFVKVSCTSAASCLALVSRQPTPWAMTTVEMVGDRLYNTRRLCRYGTPTELDRLIRLLLREGAQIERAIPKARLGAGRHRAYFDCRVLVIDGEAAFVVVRQSRLPITNLHLGGERGELGALQRACPPGSYEAMCASAVTLSRSLGAFQVGVDALFESDFRHHRVLEANAFGDLLPNLERDGRDVYDV
jgi:hypothetical protein